jgi:hypothetical protein
MKRCVISAAIVTACLSGVLFAQKDDSVPYRAAEFVQRWHQIVNETVEDLRAFTSDEFVDEVTDIEDQFMAGGAVRAAQEHATTERLKAADDAIKRLAIAMVQAGDRQSDGTTHVTPEAFFAAVKKICPQDLFCG